MKKKIILSALLFMTVIIIGNIVYGKTYSTDYVSVAIPDKYQVYYENTDNSSEWVSLSDSNSLVNVHWDVYPRTMSMTTYTQTYLNEIVSNIEEVWNGQGESVNFLHKQLIEKNGCKGMRIAYKYYDSTYGITNYHDYYYFLTDNYEVELSFSSYTSSFIDSSEEKAIVNSFKIKDTVLESRGIPFTDVSSTAWYFNSVKYVYNNSMIIGMNDYTYNPGGELTRGMLVTILWRMEGSPIVNASNKFSDVSSNSYYYKAIQWAEEKGIVSGYGNGKFKPNKSITRQELAVILRNYANYNGKNTRQLSSLSSFADSQDVASWSKSAVQWAVNRNIINGSTNGNKTYLQPTGTATRAQTATMIMNYCNNVGR